MQWNEKEFIALINKGPKIIAKNIVPYLDNPENKDIFSLNNFAYLWAILGAVNLEGMTTSTHHKIWQVLKQTDVLDAHDKGMLPTFTQNIAKNNPNITQKYWLDLDNYGMRVKFSQEILWELLKNNEDLTKEVAPYCLDGVRLVESLVDRELIPQVESYLDQLRVKGASCGLSGAGIRETYEKEAVLRKVCSIVANLKRKLAFDEKEYLFNYFHEVYLDGFDATHIGLDDGMLSRLMVDEELDDVSEIEAQKYLDHNWEIANFSKELDNIYGFCENTASKLIRHDTSHLTNMIERCMSRIEVDEKPKGVLFALELVNLNQMKTAITILIELAKKGRATEMSCFLHRILPKIDGSETMVMKILKLNLQHLHLDEVIAGNTGLKEYVLRTYLNAVEAFAEANYTKASAELLRELVNEGWFLGSRNLVYTKFIDLTNKIIALDNSQTNTICAIAKKLKVAIYTNNDIVSIGKEIEISPSLSKVIETPIIEEEKDIEAEIIDDVSVPQEGQKEEEGEEIEGVVQEEETTSQEIEEIENTEEETSEELIEEVIEDTESTEDVIAKSDEEAFQDILNQFNQDLPELSAENNAVEIENIEAENKETSDSNEDVVADEPKEEIVEETKEETVSENDNNPISIDTEDKIEEVNEQSPEEQRDRINLQNIINISSIDIDKHFEKIKDITARASEQAEKIIEQVEGLDIANSKSVEKIKEVAKKVSMFKWKK